MQGINCLKISSLGIMVRIKTYLLKTCTVGSDIKKQDNVEGYFAVSERKRLTLIDHPCIIRITYSIEFIFTTERNTYL